MRSGVDKVGYGLYVDWTFNYGDIISVYMGHKNTSVYYMHFSDTDVINAKMGFENGVLLFLGCHLVNDRIFEGKVHDQRKKYYAKFDDLKLIATSQMKKNTEILVDCNII